MKLLEKCGVLTAQNDKSNLHNEFLIDKDYEKITIDFSYSPKVYDKNDAEEMVENALEKFGEIDNPKNHLPLTNLLTISLDENSNYIGAAHRPDPVSHHEISENFASYGFNPNKITNGKWDVVINVHCVLCDVAYKLVVNGEEKN